MDPTALIALGIGSVVAAGVGIALLNTVGRKAVSKTVRIVGTVLLGLAAAAGFGCIAIGGVLKVIEDHPPMFGLAANEQPEGGVGRSTYALTAPPSAVAPAGFAEADAAPTEFDDPDATPARFADLDTDPSLEASESSAPDPRLSALDGPTTTEALGDGPEVPLLDATEPQHGGLLNGLGG